MNDEEIPLEETPLDRAMEELRMKQEWYERERELLEGLEDHQAKWKSLMRRLGRM